MRYNVHHHAPLKPTKQLIAAVARLEQLRGSRVVLLINSLTKLHSTIDFCTYSDLRSALENVHVPRLDVFIQSDGGSPNEAFKLARLFSAHSGEWSVMIAEHAKSAATLIALGASEIVMARDAELGPIDTQLADSGEPEGYISSLQEFKGLEAVASFCHTFLDASAGVIHNISMCSRNDAIKIASEYVPPLLRPLFEQVDPRTLGGFRRALEITESYGLRLLRAAGYEREAAREIVRRLVYHYPAHDYVIQHDEASEIGLPAKTANDDIEKAMEAVLDEAPDEGYFGFVTPARPARRAKKSPTSTGATTTAGTKLAVRRMNGKTNGKTAPGALS
jgi:hypothetical protein